MRNRTLGSLEHVVSLGGGHGLGRVMSALSSLGSRLTGIVTTTDNGGSTGRIRKSEGGIAWGDTRNCLNQLITEPSIASAMFEYRFSGSGELAGHNLGNLMLKALDNLSVRPLDAINLIRNLLKVDAYIIPMSEHPVDLAAKDVEGNVVYGEVSVDGLHQMPERLWLEPAVSATLEAIIAVSKAELILIGPGSFMTSLLPPLLLADLADALRHSKAKIVYIGNLAKELSPAAASLNLKQKMSFIEQTLGGRKIDGIIVGPHTPTMDITDKAIVQQSLEAEDIPYRHDRDMLRNALERMLEKFGD
ncbi:uridine diphosphate-N-acetylglucosamine-binding protein YvcK [Leminorella grimontii]|uniref:uridine diphosphate-N-acetylglucosamine-binding protein YvcK n=1 Tax=Leminorella grimontii TaxID=82981 RepID=UPI0032203FAB